MFFKNKLKDSSSRKEMCHNIAFQLNYLTYRLPDKILIMIFKIKKKKRDNFDFDIRPKYDLFGYSKKIESF